MTNKEQIQRDIAVAFDFIEQIIDNPDLTEKIPEGSAIFHLLMMKKKLKNKLHNYPQKSM